MQLFDFGVTAGDDSIQQSSAGELTVKLTLPEPLLFGGENYSLIYVSGSVVSNLVVASANFLLFSCR